MDNWTTIGMALILILFIAIIIFAIRGIKAIWRAITRKLDIEQYKAETERIKARADAKATAPSVDSTAHFEAWKAQREKRQEPEL